MKSEDKIRGYRSQGVVYISVVDLAHSILEMCESGDVIDPRKLAVWLLDRDRLQR